MAQQQPIDEAALDRELAAAANARESERVRAEATGTAGRAMGIGFRIGTELVVGVAVGVLIGYALDRWLHTNPWLMLLGLVIGFAAGLRNVFRATAKYEEKWSAADAADREGQK